MKRLTFTLLLLSALLATGFSPVQLARFGNASLPAAGGGGLTTGDVFSETFEGTGYSLSGWTENVGSGATVDEDYTTSPGTGSQSLHIVQAGDNAYTYRDFAAAGDVYIRLQYKWISGNASMLRLRDNGGTSVMFVDVTSGGSVAIYDAGNNQSATWGSSLTSGTWYYVWLHWKKSPSPTVQIAISTTTTRPSWVSNTSGNSSTDATRILVGESSAQTGTRDYDDVNMSTSDNL